MIAPTLLLLAASLTTPAAQEPGPASAPTPAVFAAPQDLAALAERVGKAHRPGGPVDPVHAFRGSLEVHLLAAAADRGGQADLLVQFLNWRREGSSRVVPLIRYEIQQAGQPIVRGRDRNGYWHLFQGEPRDLSKTDFAADREACMRDTNLARQLLRFLDPEAVLRELAKPSAVREQPLQLGREPKVDCLCVEGDLEAFPLLQQSGEDAPVRIAIYVRAADSRLAAIEVWPLVDGLPEASRGELVRLAELHERDGLLVPRRLDHFFRNEKGELRLQSKAVLTSLSLRPELRAEDFDRKK